MAINDAGTQQYAKVLLWKFPFNLRDEWYNMLCWTATVTMVMVKLLTFSFSYLENRLSNRSHACEWQRVALRPQFHSWITYPTIWLSCKKRSEKSGHKYHNKIWIYIHIYTKDTNQTKLIWFVYPQGFRLLKYPQADTAVEFIDIEIYL